MRCGGSIQLCICLLNCKGVGGERVSSSSSLLWMIECCPHGDFLADNPRTARQECNQGSQGKQKYSFTYRHLWGKTSCSSGRILQSALPCLLLGSLSCPCPSRAVPSSFYYILYLEKKILVPCQYLLKQSIIYPKLFFFLFCVTFYMMVRYRCL